MKNNVVDINESTLKNYVESLRPEDSQIREQLDYGYSFDGKIALLFEIRPFWDNPQEIMQSEFAKIRYIKSRKEWNLYWMRASGKWESYEPFPKSNHLKKLISIIKEDKYGCFFG